MCANEFPNSKTGSNFISALELARPRIDFRAVRPRTYISGCIRSLIFRKLLKFTSRCVVSCSTYTVLLRAIYAFQRYEWSRDWPRGRDSRAAQV